MELENEILFKTYGITGYDVDAPGLCDDTSGARGDQHPGPDDSEGLDSGASGHRDA